VRICRAPQSVTGSASQKNYILGATDMSPLLKLRPEDDYQPDAENRSDKPALLYAREALDNLNPPLDSKPYDANDFTNANITPLRPIARAESRATDAKHHSAAIDPTIIDPTIDDSYFEQLESDGEPMVTSTKHAQLMTRIANGVKKCLPQAFVAMDLIWYPLAKNLSVATAPDVMVILGIPQQHLSRYKQWEFDNIAPQVVFEILSNSNKPPEMEKKLFFYQQHGVQEYYIHNPENETLQGYIRDHSGQQLVPLSDAQMNGWQSPLIGMYFRRESEEWQFYTATGSRFLDFEEMNADLEFQTQRAEAADQRAEAEHQRAETERQQRELAEAKLAALAAKLRALGMEVDES
jgi:hypothetical protein